MADDPCSPKPFPPMACDDDVIVGKVRGDKEEEMRCGNDDDDDDDEKVAEEHNYFRIDKNTNALAIPSVYDGYWEDQPKRTCCNRPNSCPLEYLCDHCDYYGKDCYCKAPPNPYGKFPIIVSKKFGDVWHEGKVVGYDQSYGYYKFFYDDGDEEELERHELQKIMVCEGTMLHHAWS
jgi:hypothetical protein